MEHVLDLTFQGCRVAAALTPVAFALPGSFEAALERVSAHRREKALSQHREKDRRLSLLAGLLLDDLLLLRGLRERDMEYDEGPHGKPALHGLEGVFFSLAHSGEMAVAAMADAPVGVDVEQLEGYPRHIADPLAWTAIEARGKLHGEGVADYVDSIGGASALARISLADVEMPEGYTLIHREVAGHLVCILRAIR